MKYGWACVVLEVHFASEQLRHLALGFPTDLLSCSFPLRIFFVLFGLRKVTQKRKFARFCPSLKKKSLQFCTPCAWTADFQFVLGGGLLGRKTCLQVCMLNCLFVCSGLYMRICFRLMKPSYLKYSFLHHMVISYCYEMFMAQFFNSTLRPYFLFSDDVLSGSLKDKGRQ